MTASDLPVYGGGRAYPWRNDGTGLSDDITSAAREDTCFIQVIDETNETEFRAYLSALEAAGFVCVWQRDEPHGVYRELQKDGGLLYAYYVHAEGRARLICDNAGLPLADFTADDPAAEEGANTLLMQYGLYYNRMVSGVTCDCGMLYTLRLQNGEFIVIDGGEFEQATDAACADVMARLREQAGKTEITVALWLCTHPHNDHMELFLKLMRVYGGSLRVKRAAFNFPSHTLITMQPYISAMKRRLAEYAPGIKYLKLHTGQRFTLGGVTAEVLLTQEDDLHPTGEPYYYRGINETSAVVKFTAPDFSFTVLADIPEENGNMLVARYRRGEADCTFLQAAHHCINRIEEVYRHVKAHYVLIPEETEMIRSHMRENYETILKYHPQNRVLPAGDATAVFSFDRGVLRIRRIPAPQGPYDGSEI